MKKTILTLAALLVTTSAFATSPKAAPITTDELRSEVMSLLVANASTIELQELGEKSEANLSDILASHMLASRYIADKGTETVLTNTSVECKNVTPNGLLGATSYICNVSLMNGDFRVSSSGALKGPSLESSYQLMNIKIQKVVYPGAKATLSSKIVEVSFAG